MAESANKRRRAAGGAAAQTVEGRARLPFGCQQLPAAQLLLLLAAALFLAAAMSKEWAIKIKTVDMEEKPLAEGEKTMVDFSTDTAKEAMLANAYEQDVASYIKNAFDKKYGCARAIAGAIAAARAPPPPARRRRPPPPPRAHRR